MLSIKSHAIILHRTPYSESSFILKVFTRESGLLGFIAKGATRPKSKFRGILDLFSVLDIMYRTKNGDGLVTLTDASLRSEFAHIRSDIEKQALAHVFLEIYLRHIYGPQTSIPLFEILKDNLDNLDNSHTSKKNYPSLLCDFLLQFFGVMGFQPNFSRCIHCKEFLKVGSYQMEYDMGGPLCKSCATQTHQTNTAYPHRIFDWLDILQERGPLAASLSLRDMNQAERILLDFLSVQSSRSQSLNSYRFYQSMVRG